MGSVDRRRGQWVVGFVFTMLVAGGVAWAQQRSTASLPTASLPAGDGAASLRVALADLLDVGAEDRAIVSFLDHAAVRAGGAAAGTWFGRQVAIGVVNLDHAPATEVVEAATGVSLSEVATTLVVDASMPSVLALVRGGVDATRVDAALAARGYAAVADDRARRWCGPSGCDGGLQLNLASRDAAFALFGGVFGRSYPAVLARDLLAVGPLVVALDSTLDVAAGRAPSVLDRPEVAALVDALDVDAVVRQVWMPFGTYVAQLAPAGARSILIADARHGGDEWLLVAAAFALPTEADAFTAGALAALGLDGDADPASGTLQASLRAHATDALVDTVEHHGFQVVRILVARPFPDGGGTAEDRPAALFGAMLRAMMRVEVPWGVQ